MKKYKLALIPLFSVMALLGCGDDSSSDPVSTSKGFPEDGSSVESIYDLGSCTSDREGDIIFVEEEEHNFLCHKK